MAGQTGRTGRAEAGLTLVEVVIAVTIMGLGIAALTGAMTTTVAVSSVVEGQAKSEAEARRLAELLRSYETDFVVDDAEAVYQAMLESATSAAFVVTITSVTCGVAQVDATGGGTNLYECGNDPSLQRIGFSVAAVDGEAFEVSMVVVKRNVA